MKTIDTATGITIDADFPCGCAGEIRRTGDARFEADYRREEPPQWFTEFLLTHFGPNRGVPKEYAFCVRVTNTGAHDRRVTVRFLYPEHNGAGYLGPPHWIHRSSGWSWIDAEDTTIGADQAYAELSAQISSGESVWLASAPFIAPDQVAHRTRQIASYWEHWSCREIGRSARDRPLIALESEPRRHKIVIAATTQQAEPVAWGIFFLAHWLSIPTSRVQRLLAEIQFCLLPMLNPDGAAEGRSLTNSLGEVPKFSLADAAAGQPAPLESQALWDYLNQTRPTVYFEQHMHYTWRRPWVRRFNPVERSYLPPSLRAGADEIESAVADLLPEIQVVPIDPRKPEQSVYGAKQVIESGTLSYAYQGIPDSIENNAADLQQVIETLATALLPH